MSKKIISKSPGKLIITGEHSVVYGEPALIGSVDLYSSCVVHGSKKQVEVFYEGFGENKTYDIDELRKYFREAHDAWNLFFESGDVGELKHFQRDKYVVVKLSLGQIYDELGVCGGVGMSVGSEIPIGSGLGSSASVAAAVIGGLGEFFEARWSQDELNERVYGVEKIVHGNPSGGDNSTVIYGGLLEYRKIDGCPNLKRKEVKSKLGDVHLIQTGKPEESTGEMVKMVSDTIKNKKKMMSRIGNVSRKIIELSSKSISKDLIKENQKLLDDLGVVGEKAGNIIREIEKLDGVAKICGAGGVLGGSGIMMVFLNDEDRIKYLVDKHKMTYYKVRLGVDGWQIK